MVSYTIRRLIAMLPALLGIAFITFGLMHLTVGGPFTSEHSNPQVQAALQQAYHLDEPLWPTFLGPGADVFRWSLLGVSLLLIAVSIFLQIRGAGFGFVSRALTLVFGAIFFVWFIGVATQAAGTSGDQGFVGGQFLRFLVNISHGDLGNSFSNPGLRVTDIIAQGAKNSLVLGLTAFMILVLVSIPLGLIAALRQNTWIDYIATGLSLIGYSIPNFVLGVLLILATGLWLHIIPVAAWQQFPRDLILPAIVLAIRPMAVLTRLTRASMIEVLNQDYIRTAWAKGLQSRVVVMRHGLRNALLPVVTVMGDNLGDLITGSIVVETLFNVPGIGQFFVFGVQSRDYGMIMGTTLFYAFLVLLINLVVDLTYAVIDPRIKLGASARS